MLVNNASAAHNIGGYQSPDRSHHWLELLDDCLFPVIRTHEHMNGWSSNLVKKLIGRLYRAGAFKQLKRRAAW